MIQVLCKLALLLAAMMLGFLVIMVLSVFSGLDNIQLMQALQALLVFVLPLFLMLKVFHYDTRRFLKLNPAPWQAMLTAVLSIFLMLPFMNLVVTWNASLHLPAALAGIEDWMRQQEDAAELLTQQMLDDDSLGTLLLNLLVIAFMTAFGEEFFFRAGIIGLMKSEQRIPHSAIWFSAVVFSAIHLQFFGFFPRFLMGLWLGYLFCWTGSLWVPIAAHATNNAVVVLTQYAVNKAWLAEDFGEQIGTGPTWYLALLSLLAVLALALYFSRHSFLLEKTVSKRG